MPLGIVLAGAVIAWLCHAFPAAMPFWMPWEFSWLAWLGTALPIWWYLRGIVLLPQAERPHPARRAAFLLGMLVIYAVLQTRFLYLAEHLFFLNRIQHVAMHHLGPFLVALGVAGAPLRRAMPRAPSGCSMPARFSGSWPCCSSRSWPPPSSSASWPSG